MKPRGPYLNCTSACDVTDIESLRKNLNSNCLINLAAIHRDDIQPKSLYESVNVNGARNICTVAREKSISKIIFVSSVAVYGNSGSIKDESAPKEYFNEYGRTKNEAEQVFKEWFEEDESRSLIIIRPTVIFGPGNRGNIYNLLNQIYSKKFLMIGKGENIKSICYVKNVAAFITYCVGLNPGIHTFNYIDKPDFNMNEFVSLTQKTLKRKNTIFRVPVFVGLLGGKVMDFLSLILRKSLTISAIRVKKFISNSHFDTSIFKNTTFEAPYNLEQSLIETIEYEFLEDNSNKQVFETE